MPTGIYLHKRKEKPTFCCETCGKEFVARRHGCKRRFCSKKCFYQSRLGNLKKQPTLCLICKKPIIKVDELGHTYRPSHGQKYCSYKCLGIAKRGISINLGKKLSPEHKEKLRLVHLGKPSPLKGIKKPQFSGENHWRWNKNSLINRLVRKRERSEFRIFIQGKVFERDNYTCQICGQHGGSLQVDHIQPWADYEKGRFDINNCRTLCMGCHYFITFGKPMPAEIKSWGHNMSHIIKEVV